MNMASFNFYLKDSTSKEEQPIYLRYNDRGVNVKFYIAQKIHPKQWNSEGQQARRTFKGYTDFNSILEGHKSHLKKLCAQLQATDGKIEVEILKRKFDESLGRTVQGDKKEFKTVAEYIEHHIKGLTGKKPNTVKQYGQTLRLLKEFDISKGKKITFEKVDLDFYSDFVEFLTTDKKFSPNWIGKNIKNLKLFLGEAFERGLHTNLIYKSKKFKSISEDVESIYLSEEELLKIYNHDFSENKKLEKTRDLFIIGCYTGLRFSDFSQLKIENIKDGEIKVKTQKTGERVVIPIHWTVKEILEKYSETAKGLPRPISNQKMNEYLKDIGEEVKIKENIFLTTTKGGMKVQTSVPKYSLITTHTGRRSFATNLFIQGFPSISIMKITGHRTEKAFMKYIKISQEENAKSLRLHWSANTKLKVV